MNLSYFNALTGAEVKPDEWQMKLRKGDFFEIDTGDQSFPPIYGKILDGPEKGYFKVKAHSQWCPEGQEGLLCIVEPTRKLTKDEFESARARKWKPDKVER